MIAYTIEFTNGEKSFDGVFIAESSYESLVCANNYLKVKNDNGELQGYVVSGIRRSQTIWNDIVKPKSEEIESLHNLMEQGVISEEEFDSAKKKILGI